MILPKVTVTPAAAKFMRRMVRFSSHPTGGFRLTVTPGGCSGYASEFTVAETPASGDAEMVFGDVRVFLPAESRLVLDGVTVDFAETPTSSGLTFFNPSAGPCACSSSSDAAPPAAATVPLSSLKRH
ncbi:MAG: iron-sulfur cluster assembly accessory protein [Burkholderiales bacterium]|nr:iron-sulfur cluster assembly accessory protein [Burkholderiales bacterium]